MAGNVPNSLLKDEDPEPMDTAPKVKVKKEMVDKKCEKDDNLDKGDRAGQGEEEEEEEEDDEDDEWCEKVISKRKQKTTKTDRSNKGKNDCPQFEMGFNHARNRFFRHLYKSLDEDEPIAGSYAFNNAIPIPEMESGQLTQEEIKALVDQLPDWENETPPKMALPENLRKSRSAGTPSGADTMTRQFYDCDSCFEKFRSVFRYQNHVKQCRTTALCSKCKKVFTRKRTRIHIFNNFIKRHESTCKGPKPIPKFPKCTKCRKQFSKKEKYLLHVEEGVCDSRASRKGRVKEKRTAQI